MTDKLYLKEKNKGEGFPLGKPLLHLFLWGGYSHLEWVTVVAPIAKIFKHEYHAIHHDPSNKAMFLLFFFLF